MEKHILLCVSGDVATSYSVNFLQNFFKEPCGLKLTIFHVVPSPTELGNNDFEAKGAKLVESVKEQFAKRGFCPTSEIETKIAVSHGNIARMIVHEAHKELYDAVVIGRQNPTVIEDLFNYGVGKGLIWEEIDFPIWFCKTPDSIQRKDLLLCVGEGQHFEKMADHAGFMLADNKEHSITLLYVVTPNSPDSVTIENMFKTARELIQFYGVEETRISQIEVGGVKADKVIEDFAKKKKYAAVLLGRGIVKSGLKEKIFPTSISSRLLNRLEGAALWICK